VDAARRLYVDTSAYLSILLGESGAAALSEETADAHLLSSVLLVLETRRNLIRLAREGTLTAYQYKTCVDQLDADVGLFALRDVTLDLCRAGTIPAIATPRSFDLVHLRTAPWFHAEHPIDCFVTMDDAQKESARELGLPT
jgi:hypothetical protein